MTNKKTKRTRRAERVCRTNGAILWRGVSPVDGAPIALIATNLRRASKNAKTGDMIQTWILRTDMAPQEAVNTGADRAICGNCPHRKNPTTGARTCYVAVFRAPQKVYRALVRGSYTDLSDNLEVAKRWVAERGRPIRWGAYGDPGMVPASVIAALSDAVGRWAGYTHQSGEEFFDQAHLERLMVSRDGEFVAGARSFRVLARIEDLHKDEVLCPATPEGGNKTSCASCGLCKGGAIKAKSVALLAHGIGKAGFVPLAVS